MEAEGNPEPGDRAIPRRSVAVVGSGSVGAALTRGLTAAGHDVTVVTRDPTARTPQALSEATGAALSAPGTPLQAEVTILAVPAASASDTLATLDLAPGSLVVDATNAVFEPVPDDAATITAHLAGRHPSLVFVKAFNTTGAEHLANGRLDGARTFLPIAGADGAREVVAELAESMGFDVHDLGGPESVVHLEALARVWIHMAIVRGGGRDMVMAIHRA